MNWAACHCCGLIQSLEGITGRAECARCETRLAQTDRRRDNQPSAAAAAAALILYVPAVTLPFLRIQRLGLLSDNSLLGGIRTLLEEGHLFVGAIVLCFSVVLPLLKLGALLTLSLRNDWLPRRHRAITYRVVEHLGRWGMLDVLLVAVMIAFVKLGNLVSFSAGPGLAAFAGFVMVSIAASLLFDSHVMWHEDDAAAPAAEPVSKAPVKPIAAIPVAKPARRRPSLAWLLVLLAIVGAAAAWRSVAIEQGRLIEISFREGHGLRVGSELRHLGIAIGRVESIRLNDDASAIDVQVRLRPAGDDIARRGSRFWIVRPQVDLAGVRGLETVIGDKQIAVEPGVPGGPIESRFVGLESPPLPDAGVQDGVEIVLQATKADGLGPAVPVFYRGVRVGSIQSVQLAGDGSAIEARAIIRPEYRQLVRQNARFWNASGVSVEAGITGFRVQMGPVESWLRGRIEFAVPDNPGAEISNGYRFVLADRPEEEWLRWSPSLIAAGSRLGYTRPPQERALLSITTKSFWRTKTETTGGWLLPVEQGWIGPQALLKSDAPTAAITIAGQSLELPVAKPVDVGHDLALLRRDARPEEVARVRPATALEDGYLVAGDDAPLFVAAARMKEADGKWTIEPAVSVPRNWLGAAFVAARDHAVIGLLVVNGDSRWIAPLGDIGKGAGP